MLWLSALVTMVVALLVLKVLVSNLGRRLVLDHPNERSLHKRPVPRTGGLAIILGIAAGWSVARPGFSVTLLLAVVLAAVSLFDDVLGLPTILRLIMHLGAAAAFLLLEPRFPGWPMFVVLLLALGWYTNLYNFMDGADGLSGSMAVIGFGAYAVAAQASGAQPLATVCVMLATGAAAFLTRNFPPARLFLGDVGSAPLGFLAGALGIVGWNDGLWPLWFPVLVFAPFVCDATLTLIKRLARGERVWQAHRDHYYQRLVRSGLGHRGTLLIECVVMFACAAAAILVRDAGVRSQVSTLGGAAVGLSAVAVWVDLRWARHLRQTGSAA